MLAPSPLVPAPPRPPGPRPTRARKAMGAAAALVVLAAGWPGPGSLAGTPSPKGGERTRLEAPAPSKGTAGAVPAAGEPRAGAPAPADAGRPDGGQALFEALLGRYARFRDFRARFTETPVSRATGEGPTESGIVSFKRPGRWRWDYLEPEKKVVVVRDGVATLAIAGDPEVSRYELGGGEGGSGVGSLLEGGESVSARFLARTEPSRAPDEAVLRLDPVRLSDEYDHILVRFLRKELVIREVMVEDPGGNRLLFRFDGFKPDSGLPDAIFEPAPSASRREP